MRVIRFSCSFRNLLASRCLATLLILLFIQPAIQAFSSMTMLEARKVIFKKPASGYVHGELTRAAMCALNLRNDFVLKVVEVNWRVDWDSNTPSFEVYFFGPAKLPLKPNNKYKPDYHFDRNREDVINVAGQKIPDHKKPFVRGVAYVQSRRKIIVDGLVGRNGKNVADAQIAAGQALHALQDFFSHSNVTDLPEGEWNQVMRSLELAAGPVGPLPMTLKIAGFDKDTNADFEKPDYVCSKNPLSPYGHEACAKDSETHRESQNIMEMDSYKYVFGKTKFLRAKEAAVDFSTKWLQAIKTEVGAVNWKKIENDGTSPCQVNVPLAPSEVNPETNAFLDSTEFEAVKHGNWLAGYDFSLLITESH